MSIQEGEKVAGSFIDALKGQPLSLALVVMNIMLLGFLYYTETNYSQGRRLAFASLMEQHTAVNTLLTHCVIPEDLRKLYENLPKPQQP